MAEEEEEVLATDAALATLRVTLRVLFVGEFGEDYQEKYSEAFETESGFIAQHGFEN